MPAFPPHKTPTVDVAWDAGAVRKDVKSGMGRGYYAKIFAWYDPEGEQGNKSEYKFPHHEVHANGDPGAANLEGCSAAIGALNGARGGSSIPDGDRSGVFNHVAAHLRDAGKEVPTLKESVEPQYPWDLETDPESVEANPESQLQNPRLQEITEIKTPGLICESFLGSVKSATPQKVLAGQYPELDPVVIDPYGRTQKAGKKPVGENLPEDLAGIPASGSVGYRRTGGLGK